MDSTKDVLDRHLRCFGEGNRRRDYSSDAVLIIPPDERSRRDQAFISGHVFKSSRSPALHS